jgi:hypothetical protein
MYRQTNRMMENGVKWRMGVRLDCIFNTRWKQDKHTVGREEGGWGHNGRGTPRTANDWLISSWQSEGCDTTRRSIQISAI